MIQRDQRLRHPDFDEHLEPLDMMVLVFIASINAGKSTSEPRTMLCDLPPPVCCGDPPGCSSAPCHVLIDGTREVCEMRFSQDRNNVI